ncbi:MAG: ABC transporter ATP-binding protein [Ferruginibacter sp.]|nr:ABC transporter ATP-binding protein [Cytophagales bacterium]
MVIEATDLGRRFNRQWVFRRLSFRLEADSSYVFTGPNGSGKSTLLQILAGTLPATEGRVAYRHGGKTIEPEDFYRHLVIAAPYLELVEELTLAESFHFHTRFKRLRDGLTVRGCAERLGLAGALNKPVKHFSSGMKQRLKLGLAFFSDTPVLMLDEPTTNLDAQGAAWYREHVPEYSRHRLLILCSNQPQEYAFCGNVLDLGTASNGS